MDISKFRIPTIRASSIIAVLLFLHLIGVYIYEGGTSIGVAWGSTNIGLIGEAPTIPNPLEYGKNRQTDLILKFLFRGLISYNVATTSYSGDIATCDIWDLSKVVCTLKDGQLWSDGTEIQSEDIIATYQAFRNNSTNEKVKNFLGSVSIVSPGPKTIEFSAKEKNSLMLDILSYPIVRSDMLERIKTNRFTADGYLTSGSYVFTEKVKNEQYGYERITIKRNTKNPGESWLDKYNFLFFPNINSLERGNDNLNIIVPSIKKEKIQLSPRFAPYNYTLQEYIWLFANTDTIDKPIRQQLILQAGDSLSGITIEGEKRVENILGNNTNNKVNSLTKSLGDILREKWYTKVDEKLSLLEKENGMLTGSSIDYGNTTWIDNPSKKKIFFNEWAEWILAISGKTPAGTLWVNVNDYILKEYWSWNSRFSYKVSLDNWTLKEGKNTYTIQFIMGTGGTSTGEMITVYYSKDANYLTKIKSELEAEYLAGLNTPEQVNSRLAKVQSKKTALLALDQRYYYNEKFLPYTLHITYIDEPASLERYAITLSEALTNLGIKSDLTRKDNKWLAEMLQKWEKNYDFIIVGFEASGRLSRIGQVFLSSEAKMGINFAKIESKSLDAFFANLRIANTKASVDDIIKKIQDYLDSEAFFLPISSPIHTLYIDKNLKGIQKIDTFQDITTLYGVVKKASIKENYHIEWSQKNIPGFFHWLFQKSLLK